MIVFIWALSERVVRVDAGLMARSFPGPVLGPDRRLYRYLFEVELGIFPLTFCLGVYLYRYTDEETKKHFDQYLFDHTPTPDPSVTL